MKMETRTRKGALFLTAVGKEDTDKIAGYKVVLGGVAGVAYMKGDRLIAFKPMEQFLMDYYSTAALIIEDAGPDKTVAAMKE